MVGNGIPKLVERFSPEGFRSTQQLADTLAQFTARYDAHKEDKTAPYPGIPQLLAALKERGVQTAVFSNKADALCGGIIDHYFAPGSFAAVRGNRPGVPVKPDPTGVYSLMEQLGAKQETTLFVGDSNVDIATGPQRRPAGPGGRVGIPRRRGAPGSRGRRPGLPALRHPAVSERRQPYISKSTPAQNRGAFWFVFLFINAHRPCRGSKP